MLHGECRSIASAMWTLGCTIHLLLVGIPPGPGSLRRAEGDWADVSSEAVDTIEQMLQVDTAARLSPAAFLETPWVRNLAGGVSAAGAQDGPLTSAHAAINGWYDELLFDVMSDRLAQMSEA